MPEIGTADRSVSQQVLAQYPLPIAFEYWRYLRQCVDPNLLRDVSGDQLRAVVWFTVRYLACITISSYMKTNCIELPLELSHDQRDGKIREACERRTQIHALTNKAINGNQADPNEQTLGDQSPWIVTIGAIAQYWRDFNVVPFFPEIMTWAHQGGLQEGLDELNYCFGAYDSVVLSKGDVHEWREMTEHALLTFLDCASFLRDYRLVNIEKSTQLAHSISGLPYNWRGRQFMGHGLKEDPVAAAALGTLEMLHGPIAFDAAGPCPQEYINRPCLLDRKHGAPKLLLLEPLAIFARRIDAKTAAVLRDPLGDYSRASLGILNDRERDAVYYRSVPLGNKETADLVSVSEYLATLDDLLTPRIEPIVNPRLGPEAPWQERREPLRTHNAKVLESMAGSGGEKYAGARYLERVLINQQIEDFLNSQARILLIVDDAGVGKTNLMCHWTERLQATTNSLVLLYDARALRARDVDDVSVIERIADDLGFSLDRSAADAFDPVLATLTATRPADDARVVVIIDALNENPLAHHLLAQVATKLAAPSTPAWLKVIVTCRTEPWQRFLRYELPAGTEDRFYGADRAQAFVTIGRFTIGEVERAYTDKYMLKPAFTSLPRHVQDFLTDPLMLGLVHRAYRTTEVPPDLHQNRLLSDYLDELLNPAPAQGGRAEMDRTSEPTAESEELDFLRRLLQKMYEGKTTELRRDVLENDPILTRAYDSSLPLMTDSFLQLLSDLLRESVSGDIVTFRYERVFEFALARYILRPLAEAENWSVEWVEAEAGKISEYPSIWGALRSLLSLHLEESSCEPSFVEALARSAQYEVRKLIGEAMVNMAQADESKDKIHRAVLTLADSHATTGRNADLAGEVALSVARRLGWTDVFETGARNSSALVRLASVQAIYYTWRHDRKKGVSAMRRIASLMRGEMIGAAPGLATQYVGKRLGKGSAAGDSPLKKLPLTSSLLSLTMLMLSHCLREPDTRESLWKVWGPIINSVPRWLDRPVEGLLAKVGTALLSGAWGDAEAKGQSLETEKRDAERVINAQNLQAAVTQDRNGRNRRTAVKYLPEIDPAKGPLTPIKDVLVEVAQWPDALLHFMVQLIMLVRDDATGAETLEICRRLCESDNPYARYEGTTKMGVFLYSVAKPPQEHMEFMEEQVLWIWQGELKFLELAGEKYLLDQIRYPLMYECSPLGKNRKTGRVEFVERLRELPPQDWVDRDIAIIRALAEAAVFGHITYNVHVIPFLETIQQWFSDEYEHQVGSYFETSVWEAVASSLSRIRQIFPDEVERYLTLAPAKIRESEANQREESAAAFTFTGGQAAMPWLFMQPEFRKRWVNGLTRMAAEADDLKECFQMLAADSFSLDMLRAILSGEQKSAARLLETNETGEA